MFLSRSIKKDQSSLSLKPIQRPDPQSRYDSTSFASGRVPNQGLDSGLKRQKNALANTRSLKTDPRIKGIARGSRNAYSHMLASGRCTEVISAMVDLEFRASLGRSRRMFEREEKSGAQRGEGRLKKGPSASGRLK